MKRDCKKRLQQVIEESIITSALYKDKYIGKDLNYDNLPVLTKEELKQCSLDKNCTNFPVDPVVFFTSGSTGVPLKVYWEKREYQMSNYQLWYLRKKWYDISPKDKYVTFFSHESFHDDNYYIEQDKILYLKRCNYDKAILNEYINLIKKFSPSWIQVPISLFWVFYNYLKDSNQRFERIKYVELNGEFVSEEELEKVRICCGKHIQVANLYGAVEVNGIALSCPFSKLHILNNNVYLDDSVFGRKNELIVTSFYNRKFPIIKYDIGDRGSIQRNVNCECGICADVLCLEYGRSSEIFQLIQENSIDARIFFDIIIQADKKYKDIYKYLLRKEGNRLCLCIYTLGKRDVEIKKFCDYKIKEIVNNIEVFTEIKGLSELNCERKIRSYESGK